MESKTNDPLRAHLPMKNQLMLRQEEDPHELSGYHCAAVYTL